MIRGFFHFRSLKYVDLNIFNHSSFHRSTIETEIGSVACYLGVDSVTYQQIASKPAPLSNLRSGFGNLHVCQLRNELRKGKIGKILYTLDFFFGGGDYNLCSRKPRSGLLGGINITHL